MIYHDDSDEFPEELPDDWDNEGFGSMDSDDLDDEPGYLLEDHEMFRVLCNTADAITKARRAGKLDPGYNLILLEDLEGRICHIHRAGGRRELPELVSFPIYRLPESGNMGDRQVATVDDFKHPEGPRSVFRLREALKGPDEAPIVSYYVEITRS